MSQAKTWSADAVDESLWFMRPFRVDNPAFRLFLFHHAGGSATSFYSWLKLFPRDWEVVAVELPGRGGHASRAPLRSLDALVDALARAIEPLTHSPFGFFGHSMGAMVAYELQRALLDRGSRSARWLGVSAKSAPQFASTPTANVHLQSDAVVARYLVALGGTPPHLLEDAELRAFFLTPFRADMRLVEQYAPPERAPIATPVSAFGGLHDPRIPVHEVKAWARETAGPYEERFYDGGHFYLHERVADVAGAVAASITRHCPLPTRT